MLCCRLSSLAVVFFGVDIASIEIIIEEGSRDRGPAFQNEIKQKKSVK